MSIFGKNLLLNPKGKIVKKSWDKPMTEFGGIKIRDNAIISYLIPPIVEDLLMIQISTWNKEEGKIYLIFIDTRTAFNLYGNPDATLTLKLIKKPKNKYMEDSHNKYLSELKDALINIKPWYKETTSKISQVAYEPKVSSRRKIQDRLRKAISKRIETMGY